MYSVTFTNELYHHGILGQKWGIRRYQNSDGSLTEAGKKRISEMNPSKVYKSIKKEVRKAKAEKHGLENQFKYGEDIGENSKKAIDEIKKAREKYINDEDIGTYLTKFNAGKLDETWAQGYGKDVTIAYLLDLGYDKIGAKYIADIIAKEGKFIG